jgi:hypothetical protein
VLVNVATSRPASVVLCTASMSKSYSSHFAPRCFVPFNLAALLIRNEHVCAPTDRFSWTALCVFVRKSL